MSIAAYLAKLSEGVNSSGILATSKGGTGTTSGGAFPTITSISYGGDNNDTATDTSGGRTVTITGANFAANATILINGVAAPVVSVVSASTITFTTPAMAAGTYVLYMVNADGSTAIAVPGISYSGVPAWSTAAGTVATITETTAISASLSATSNSAVTLSVLSGTLPPGAVFNSNGTISGTSAITASPTTYTFTVRATDTELQDTDRQFSIVINPEIVTFSNPTNGGTVLAYSNLYNTINLSAIGSAGNAISSYSANTLPAGLTLSGSTITGTAASVGTSSTTLTATTANTNKSTQITFNWSVTVSGDLYWKNTALLLSGTSTADSSLSDYLILNNQLVRIGDTRTSNFNPYQAGYYSNQFNGSGDYLTIPHNTQLNLSSGDFTIEAWVYWSGANASAEIVNKDGVSGSSYPSYAIAIASNKITFVVGSGNGTSSIQTITPASTTFPINTWTHVAGVRSGTTLTVYQNGVNVASATQTSTVTDGGKVVCIGFQTGQAASSYWGGSISNVRIVKGTAVYTANFTPSTTPLTAISGTTLLTCQSNQFRDAGPNNFAITTAGTPSIQQFNPFGVPATATTNNLYSAYLTSATDSRLTVPAGTAFAYGTGDFTVECWFFVPDMTGSSIRIIFSQTVSGTNYFVMGPQSSGSVLTGKITFTGVGSGGGTEIVSGSNLFTAGTWNHAAVCRVSGTVTVYLNGVGGTPTANATDFSNTSYVPTIGGYTHVSTGYNINGYLSNFRVVKGTAVYTSNFTPATANLTAIAGTSLLTFQDATIKDNSASALTITNVGTARLVAQSPFTQTTSTISLNSVGSTYFDGTGDAAYIAGDGNVVNFGNGNYTVEAWIYTTTGFCIMDTCPGGLATPTNRIQFNINADASVSYITYQGNVTLIMSATGLAPLRQWNHVALVKSNSQTRIYVNGVQGGSTYADTLTMPSQGNRPFIMGNGYDGGQGGTGYISNYRITKGTAIYTTPFAPPTAPLTAVNSTQALLFQTSQAPNNSQFVDNSSASNPITRFGNTTQGTFAPYGANWSTYFDGTGDWITVTAGTQWQFTGDYTLEAWIYVTVLTDGLIFGTGGSGSADQFGYASDGRFYFANVLTATGLITTNNWIHVAASRSGTTQKLFINGVVQLTSTISGTIGQNLAGYIGRRNDTYSPVNGYISNLRIVNGTALYTANFIPQITPLTPVTNTVLLTCQSAGFVDNSAKNNVVSNVGDTKTQRFSPYGATIQTPQTYSGYFDGSWANVNSGDYLALNGQANFAFGSNNFTVEMWVYATSFSANVVFYDSRPGNTSGAYGIFYYDTAGIVNWNVNALTITGTAITLNTWNHLAVSRSGTTTKLFINGAQAGTATDTNSYLNGALAPTIGTSGYSRGSNSMQGYISNVRVVNGTAVYTTTFTPSITPLTAIANTQLLTCQSTTFVDNSTNAFAITTVNEPRLRAFNPFGYTNTQGSAYTPALYGSSAYFDGTGDWLTIPTNTNISFASTVAFTVEFWMYPTAYAVGGGFNDGRALVSTSGTYPEGWRIEMGTANLILYSYTSGTTITTPISINTWTHVAVTHDGTTSKLYKNGILAGSAATTWSAGVSSPFYIGALNSGSYILPYLGYISDVRLVKGTAIYTSNFVPPQAPLTATTATTLLLNMDKGALVDYTKSVNLETVADTKINNESAYNGGYYSNYFDGSGDTFSTPAGLSTAMGTGFAGNILSFECWVFPQNHNFNANAQMIAGAYAAVAANGRWYIGFDKTANATTQLIFGWTISSGSQTGVTTTVFPITHGQWNHIAVTVDATTAASSTVKLFANGLLLNTFTAQDFSSQTAYWQPTQIGGCGSTTYTSEFHGYISNFRILKGSLAYTTNYTVPTAPLTAITNTVLLTCQSNTFKDNSIGTFALTRNGDVSVRSFNPFQRNTKTSMYFDGTGDSLKIPSSAQHALGTSNFTIEMWAYNSSTTNRLLSYATTNAPIIYFNASNFLLYENYGVGTVLTSSIAVPLNTWAHIAVCRSSGVTKIFINGVEGASGADTNNWGQNGIYIGVDVSTTYMTGYIDDLRITRYARYTANFTPPSTKWPSN
jgi:hypothetical protein